MVKKQIRRTTVWNLKTCTFSDKAIMTLIRHYTREAGVRNLEREISSVCRKVAREVVKEGEGRIQGIRQSPVAQIPRRYQYR